MNYVALHSPFLVAASPTQLTIREFTIINLINFSTDTWDKAQWLNDYTFTVTDVLDQGTSLQAGKDYYVYLVTGGLIKVSLNSTYPNGYDGDTSRKIGGFHTLCADVGTISGHMLSGLTAGSILPNSVWCLNFRPTCSPEGMVYCAAIEGCWKQPPSGVPQMPLWVDIYLQSGTGASTASVYGGTITNARYWDRHVDDLGAVGKRLLFDHEFTIAAYGSNAKTNIYGGSLPSTTGGHVDSAGRRMVSHWGCEDCCGVISQWLNDSSFRYDVGSSPSVAAASHTATVYHAATPGGNRVYLKYGIDGQPYLCSNLATLQADKWVAFGSHAIQLKHDTNASSGLAVYINKAANYAYNRLLVNNTATGKDAFCISSLPDFSLKITHNTGASSYPALYFNDGADMRFEATMDGTNGTVDLCASALPWDNQDLGDNLGSFYRQSSYGQGIKLQAGGAWDFGPPCGPRCRNMNSRWTTSSLIGGRGCAEPRKT
jgi:hypothetical protein